MRDAEKSSEYFEKYTSIVKNNLDENAPIAESFHRIEGRPILSSGMCSDAFRICIMKYSKGDAIEQIRPSVWDWVTSKEIHARIVAKITPEQKGVKQMYERVQLDTVYDALTMMAFARALHFSASEMKRLFDAIGHAGEDALIDEAARALGGAERPVAQACKFPKVYDPLLEVWRCDPSERPAKLLAFSKVWKKKIKPIYWSDSLNGADGAYFGYWCFDVALAAIALDIPDEALRDNPCYPKDLVDAARAE